MAHRRTCRSSWSARLRSRECWTTPAIHKRVETVMANPIQATILHRLEHASGPVVLVQRSPDATVRQCAPTRSHQSATVRSSCPSAWTITWTGQPEVKSVTTITLRSTGLRKPSNIVPRRAALRFLHAVQRYRCLWRFWMTMLPKPLWSLAECIAFGQNADLRVHWL